MSEMTVERRGAIERTIARRLVRKLLAAGYKLGVNDGEETLFENSGSYKLVTDALFSVDEEHLLVFKDSKRVGWIFFVYGNEGWDVVNDFTTNLSEIVDPILEDAEKRYAQ